MFYIVVATAPRDYGSWPFSQQEQGLAFTFINIKTVIAQLIMHGCCSEKKYWVQTETLQVDEDEMKNLWAPLHREVEETAKSLVGDVHESVQEGYPDGKLEGGSWKEAQQMVVDFINVKSLQSRARAFGDKECNRLNEKWNQFLNLDPDGMALPATSIKVHHQIWVGVTTSGNPIQVYLHIKLYILRFTRPPEQASEHFFKRLMYHDLLWVRSGLVKEMESVNDKPSNTNSTETAPEDVDSAGSDSTDTFTAVEGHYSNLDTAFSVLPPHEHK